MCIAMKQAVRPVYRKRRVDQLISIGSFHDASSNFETPASANLTQSTVKLLSVSARPT